MTYLNKKIKSFINYLDPKYQEKQAKERMKDVGHRELLKNLNGIKTLIKKPDEKKKVAMGL